MSAVGSSGARPGTRGGSRTPPASSAGAVPGGWLSRTSAERDLGLLSDPEVRALRTLGTVHRVGAGTVVATAGSSVTQVQVVVDGELELMARLDEGRVTMAVVRSGGVIMDIPLLLGSPMPFDAVASRDSEVVALSRERWVELLAASPSLSLRWMTSIARRLDDDRRRLVVITSKPLVAQVAYLLLDLAETDPAGGQVVRLTHTTMAHLLGARRQSVSRVMARLRQQELVSTTYASTAILDPQGLREAVGRDPLP